MSADDAEQLTARANLCRFLAGCYYEPGPEFIEEKLFESMHDVAARIDADVALRAQRLGEAFAADEVQTLLVDYTRLFLGPVKTLAQPYGSVWLGGGKSQVQDSTASVLRLYAEGGFEMDEEFRDLPDHIAVELEFLYLLLYRRAQAHRTGDADALGETMALQRRLLDEHLGRWVDSFTAAMREGAQCEFYRQLAELTTHVVALERAGGG